MASDASTVDRTAANPAIRRGPIWRHTTARRSQNVRRVCESLLLRYGRPRLGNPDEPVDDLVFIILSNKTSPKTASSVFRQLKREFVSWEKLAVAPLATIRRVLRPAGLSHIRSRQLRATLRRIETDFGACTLSALMCLSQLQVESYLTSLSGVSVKVAKCVMLYTMGFDVLPVDAHVHRIAIRLGWINRKRADQCHDELEAIVPPKYRYVFHVGGIMHGRQVCRPVNPKCDECSLRRLCQYQKEHNDGSQKANRN